MRTIALGLLADEGLPMQAAESIAEHLRSEPNSDGSNEVRWAVDVCPNSVGVDENGRISLTKLGRERQESGWDAVVLLTDLPRRAGQQPIVSDYSLEQRAGLLSMPALGAFAVQRRAQHTVVQVLEHLLDARMQLARRPRRVDRFAPLRHIDSDDEEVDEHLVLLGVRGRLRLLSGMVRDNRPWRLVPHLAGATAAAAATSAYGVVTTSFWSLADSLASWRLALINVAAVLAMATWLLLYNNLWERPASKDEREKALLYNVSTVVTLTIGVACMYLILFALSFLAALAVIDQAYLTTQLGHPASWIEYAGIVWLSSSVGIVAGALGSSFESEAAVRKATYSKRERERQAKNTRD
jgi:hypothetical protein